MQKEYSFMNILFCIWEILKIRKKEWRKKLIYTTTFNPALDYVINIDDLKAGEINRSKKEDILAGGKGINVSIVLKELGIESTTLGFISGFVGEEIERKIKALEIKTDFIKIENEVSRINVKIVEKNKETAINSKGPFIDNKYIELLYKKIEMIKDGDILVLSGSVPKGIKNDIYQNICKKIAEKKIKVIVDSTQELLLKTLIYKPFLIKPNKEELEEIFKVKILNRTRCNKICKKTKNERSSKCIVIYG